MRSDGPEVNKTLCCCKQSTCLSFGYCGRGRFCLPTDATQRQSWFDAAGIKANATDESEKLNKGKKYLAYWHFDEARRRFNEETQMWELVGRHKPHQHTDGRRTKHFNFLVPCNPLLGFRDEVRATRRDSERDDSAKTRRIMRASPGMNDLERAFVEFERADAAEADVAALRAEEQAVLASAGCKTMVELAAKLQSLKDASGAEALHDAVEAPRGTAAAAAANGPPALKPGLKPLRYEDCLDGNIEKQIRGSTPNSALSHSTPSLPATRRARLLAGLGGPGPGPGWSILKFKIILNTARSKKALKFCCCLVSLLIRLAEYAGGFRRLLVTQGALLCSRNGSWQ